MDANAVIDALGGGASAVMVVGLGMIAIMLWRRLGEEREGRLNDMRQNNQQLMDLAVATNKALDALSAAIKDGGNHG